MNSDLIQVKINDLPHHFEDNGDLIVMEKFKNVPFEIQRVFAFDRSDERRHLTNVKLESSQYL